MNKNQLQRMAIHTKKALEEYNSAISPPTSPQKKSTIAPMTSSTATSKINGPVTAAVIESLFPRRSERRHRIVTQSSPTTSPVKNPASQALTKLHHLEDEQKVLSECINNNNVKLNKKNQLDLLFAPYDLEKSGEVTYNDFSSTLIKSGINLNKSEIFMLIKNLDKKNKGMVNYKNLKNDLENLKKENDSKLSNSNNNTNSSSSSSSSSLSIQNPSYQDESSHEPEGYYNAYLRSKNSPNQSNSSSPLQLSTPSITTKIRSLSPNNNFKIKHALEEKNSPSNKFVHQIADDTHTYLVEKEQETKFKYNDAHRSTMAPYLVFSDANSNLEISSKIRRAPSAPPRINSASTSSLNNLLRHQNEQSSSNSSMPTSNQKKIPLTKPTLRSELESRTKRSNSTSSLSTSKSPSIIESHPYFLKQKEAKEKKLNQEKDEAKLVDTTILTQLKSKFPLFRHHLNALDSSKSGLVNYNELKSIFKKLDVNLTEKQTKIFFDKYSSTIDELSKQKNIKSHSNFDTREVPIGTLTNNKGIYINSLIENLESKLISSTFQYNFKDITVPGANDNLSNYIRNNKEIKLFKNILYNFNKNHNIDKLLSHVAPDSIHSSGRWVTPKQLREVIEKSGTNITDIEFDYVLNKLDKKVTNSKSSDNNVLVSLNSIDEVINRAVQIGTYENSCLYNNNLTNNPRYSNTYRSQISLGSEFIETKPINDEVKSPNTNSLKKLLQSNNISDIGGYCNAFSPISTTRKVRQERQHWEKLRDLLQNHYSQALEAFIENKNDKNTENKIKASLVEPHLHKTSYSNQYNNKLQSKFQNYTNELANSNTIKLDNLQEKFSKAGILLGSDDIKFIQNEIIHNRKSQPTLNSNDETTKGRDKNIENESYPSEIKFEEFCRAFDLSQSKNIEASSGSGSNAKINNAVSFVNFNKNNVQFNAQKLLSDPIYNKNVTSDSDPSVYKNSLGNTISSKINDYLKTTNENNENKLNFLVESNGIFTSSRNSIHGNPTYSLSAFFNNENSQAIKTYNLTNKDTVKKFWEFQKSNDNPMAFAYPLKSYRDPLPPKQGTQNKMRSKSADPRLRSFYTSSTSAPNSPLSVRTTSLSQYYYNQMNTSDSLSSSNNRYSTETLVPNYSQTPKTIRLNNVKGSSTFSSNIFLDDKYDNNSTKTYSQYNKGSSSRSTSAPPSLRRQNLYDTTTSKDIDNNSPTTNLKNNVSKWTSGSTLSNYMQNKSSPSTPIAGKPTPRRPTTPNAHGSQNAPFATDY